MAHTCECGCSSYGQHLRNKGIRIAYANSASGWDFTKQQKWDRELARYRGLKEQGIEPTSTTHAGMDKDEKRLNS